MLPLITRKAITGGLVGSVAAPYSMLELIFRLPFLTMIVLAWPSTVRVSPTVPIVRSALSLMITWLPGFGFRLARLASERLEIVLEANGIRLRAILRIFTSIPLLIVSVCHLSARVRPTSQTELEMLPSTSSP